MESYEWRMSRQAECRDKGAVYISLGKSYKLIIQQFSNLIIQYNMKRI